MHAWRKDTNDVVGGTGTRAPLRGGGTVKSSGSVAMTKSVSQGESRYGTPEPQIKLGLPKGTSHRVVKAALHKLAAEIELATPASERWCVNIEDFNESGRVYVELADATPAEAARGMALLTELLG